MIKSKKQMYIVIGVFTLVMMLGTVTYAFFNYTRTGTANTIRTGRVAFNSSQGQAINLTNIFPIDVSEGIPNDATKVGSVTINVTGDTTYNDGIEYLISAVNVSNSVGSKKLPISIDVSYTANGTGKTIGEEDNDYFTNRNSTLTSIYHVLAKDTITEDGDLIVGYIKSGQTGIDGNIVIKAFIDKDEVAISDTYNGPEATPNANMGTTSEWVNNRTVFTTTEWNSLQTTGVSFQIKVEANEGIWVDEPVTIPTVLGCNGCKFIFTENEYNFSDTDTSTIGDFETNNETLVDDYRTLNKNVFLGFEFNGSGSEAVITHAYACGIKREEPNDGTAFCIEGSTDGSTFTLGKDLITGATLWNDSELTDTCSLDYYGTDIDCTGTVIAGVSDIGSVYTQDINNYCQVIYDGDIFCGHY